MSEPSLNEGTVFVDIAKSPESFALGDELRSLIPQSEVVKMEEHQEPEGQVAQPIIATKFEPDDCVTIQPRRIKCPECLRYSAETEEKMHRHIRKVHRGENPFQCYMCDYTTYNKSLFEEHVRIHQGIKPFKCSYCSYRSVSKKNTKKHELIHRPNNPLKCPDCDYIARHKRSFNCHRMIHKRLNCEECSHVAENAEALTEHKEIHFKVEGYTCKSCNFYSSEFKQFRNHRKSRKSCKLKTCLYVACNGSMLKKHMMSAHSEEQVEKIKKERVNGKKFKCDVCCWSSRSKARILLHLIHHPNQEIDENVIDISILRKYDIIT